jgi:hypothetical protein
VLSVGFGRFKISDIDAEEKLTDEEVEKYTKVNPQSPTTSTTPRH